MNKKSKFITFILSFMPGLGHVYLGAVDRAAIFFALFFGAILGVLGIAYLFRESGFVLALGIALPVIWLISLVDALSTADRYNYSNALAEGHQEETQDQQPSRANQKLIAAALSVVPGAGHMYLGLQGEGLFLMTIFFFAIFMMSWLGMSLFLFALPIIWFYSLFDALHAMEEGEYRAKTESYLITWVHENPRYIGWGLIITGCFAVFHRIVSPYISWQIRSYIQTGVVALVLILMGIRLVTGSKEVEKEAQDDEIKEEETSCNDAE